MRLGYTRLACDLGIGQTRPGLSSGESSALWVGLGHDYMSMVVRSVREGRGMGDSQRRY